MKRSKFVKSLGSMILATMMVAPVGPIQVITQSPVMAATTSSGLATKVEDGVTLVACDWSFNAIKNRMADIAAAGYTSVQTSPIQGTKESTTSSKNWWLLYQPTNQAIGNAQLGSRDDFKAMCAEADKYGVKIIIDAIMNHMANNGNYDSWTGVVDPAFDRSDFYHNKGQCSQWDNRYCVTQQGVGMPDLNTQSSAVQDKAKEFLNDCINCGADGFRFDAAKHIETDKGSDAGQSWAGNYWGSVTSSLRANKSDVFLYGEVLQGGADNIAGYTSYIRVTDHNYGGTLRNAVKNKNLAGIGNYNSGLAATKLVSYFENHDTYHDGNSTSLSDYERKMCWGILAARADVEPLLLSRPGSYLGAEGESLWKNEEIVAINFFHNAMAGQNEYIRYPKNEAVVIDRGTIGTAIINTSDSFYLNSTTNLKDGSYTDKAGSGATFNVSGGKITGNVPGGRIVVLGNYTIGGSGSGTVTPSPTATATTPVEQEAAVNFSVNATTTWGQNVYVVGNVDALGNWSPDKAVMLSSANYPVWSNTIDELPTNTTISFKFIKKDSSGNVTWESGDNRTVTTGATGSTVNFSGSWK